MPRFEKFPRKEKNPQKKKGGPSNALGGAGEALEALLTLSTLGLLEPPKTGKRKKEK